MCTLLHLLFVVVLFMVHTQTRGEGIPSSLVTLNHAQLATWYDSTQMCMMEDRSRPRNSSYWQVLWGCEADLAALPENNGTKPWHRHGPGFGVLPSSAYSRKTRDGCCNGDVHVRDRGFDWSFPGFENGTEQRQCIELMTLLSRQNMSVIFMGDSMNNQVYTAFIEECHREGIQGGFDGGQKGALPWVHAPEAHGLTRRSLDFVSAVIRFDWAANLRQMDAMYNNSVVIYVIDIWYGRRMVSTERVLMEDMVPLLIRNHPSGIVILPNIGHHLEGERGSYHTMISTVAGFLNWMHELTKLGGGKSLVLFRETTPSHFDSPDHDGSFEKWRWAGGHNFDFTTKNPWDDASSQSPYYRCRAINSTLSEKNTLENLVVREVLTAWAHTHKSRLKVLHMFKHLAPFYRLKYGNCGGYDRIPVLDCVHFCAWSPTAWISIWQELVDLVKEFVALRTPALVKEEDEAFANYSPFFAVFNLKDVAILRRTSDGALYLYYHGVRRPSDNMRIIEEEIGVLQNDTANFPLLKNMTEQQLSLIPLGPAVEPPPTLKDNIAIEAHGDQQIYWYKNGTRHAVPNWDTFCALGFNRKIIVHISGNVLARIKVGDPVAPRDWPTGC